MKGSERFQTRTQDDAPSGPLPPQTTEPATLDTAGLFAGGRNEVRLIHRGQEYRLRITRQGKLILTK